MKKIKINQGLEPMDEWTFESYMSDYLYENVCIETSFTDGVIDSCKFVNCHFKDCTFHGIECMDVIFEHCEFENAHFISCNLTRVHFISCRISGLELSESLLCDVLFQLCKANYCNFGGSRFNDCLLDTDDFTSSGFIQCEVKKTVFKKCVMNSTEWFNTSLKKLDFSSCEIENIGVSNNQIAGVIVNERQALQFVKLLGIVVKD